MVWLATAGRCPRRADRTGGRIAHPESRRRRRTHPRPGRVEQGPSHAWSDRDAAHAAVHLLVVGACTLQVGDVGGVGAPVARTRHVGVVGRIFPFPDRGGSWGADDCGGEETAAGVALPYRGDAVDGAGQGGLPVGGGVLGCHADVGHADLMPEAGAEDRADEFRDGMARDCVVADPSCDGGVVVAGPVFRIGGVELFGQASVGDAGALDQRGQQQVGLGHPVSVGPGGPETNSCGGFTPGVNAAPPFSMLTPCCQTSTERVMDTRGSAGVSGQWPALGGRRRSCGFPARRRCRRRRGGEQVSPRSNTRATRIAGRPSALRQEEP
jgi:hypothetical protein